MERKRNSVKVPCNGCTLCCQGDAIRLLEEDDPAEYITEPHAYIPGALMLAHKSNGDCIYLDGKGCSIHHRAPSLCRAADCRSLAFKYNFETALKLHEIGRIDLRVWDKGNELIKRLQRGKLI
ncbi:MAG TPA: YkgJ family cysteine cluster protein [Ignavibacteriaceae bacterium]